MGGGEMLWTIAGKRWERVGKYSDKMLDKPGGGHYNISVAMRQYEPLAQSAEHLTFNQRARGSNPRWFTKRKRRPKASFSFGEPLPYHSKSSPAGELLWWVQFYFLRERTAMPRAETAMRAAAAATISLAPVVGFFWSSVLGVSPAGVMMTI